MQKGFAPILVLVGILVLGLVAGGSYYFGKFQVPKPQPQTPQPTTTPDISPVPNGMGETVYTEGTRSANWKTVQTIIDLELKYPSDWYLEESGSSQFPIVRIQNYPVQQVGSGAYNKGEFYFTIQRFPVGNSGIYSQEDLISRLPKVGDSFMYVGSSEKLVIYQQENIKISQYSGVHRIYGIESSANLKEEIYYVLNPNGSVILVEPKLDVLSQKQTFNQIFSTFRFTQ